MKQVLILLLLFITVKAFSQDSVKVTISPLAKDLYFISAHIFNDDAASDFYDSLKVKLRVANPPTNQTVISITAITSDWLYVYNIMNNDLIGVKSSHAKRVGDLLRFVNQVYLTGKLDDIDAADLQTDQTFIQFGRLKITKKAN